MYYIYIYIYIYIAKDHASESLARDFGGVNHLRLQRNTTLQSNIFVYYRKVPDYAPSTVMIT